MLENKYNENTFFEKYSQMSRSQYGLTGAGEWPTLQKLLPDFTGQRVLDLGCGYGWHCLYALKNGAASVTGIDLSSKMLAVAATKTQSFTNQATYSCQAIENINFPTNSFDVVISSLAFHYVESFDEICQKVAFCLSQSGNFIFSVEHPIFTAMGDQQWYQTDDGNSHWPVDNYFLEGKRIATFLDEPIVKYHKTLTTYLNGLLKNGFIIDHVIEPQPTKTLLANEPQMQDELRRPMMLIISAHKR